MNLQVQQNMNDQNNSPNTNGVTKSPTASSGSQGAVAQLDDTGRGMSGNIRHPEGCLWKNNNNKDDLREGIFDQWPKSHLGLDGLSNQKILKGI
jgi:hypothetical protein